MSSEKPNFTVSVLLPGLIFGPPVHFVSDLKAINYSSDVFYALFNGSNEVVPGTSFVSYVGLLPIPPHLNPLLDLTQLLGVRVVVEK